MIIDKQLKRRLTGELSSSQIEALRKRGPSIWVHASSVGEVTASVPLLAALKAREPETPVVLTTFTPTGCMQAERVAEGADLITIAPYDLPGAVRRFVEGIRPKALLLIESELWPNTIRLCGAQGCRIAIVSGRVTPKSFRRYRWMERVVRSVIRNVQCVGAQSEADAERFIALGVPRERVYVTGNLKFAAISEIPHPEETRQRLGIPDDRRVWVAGSTREGEEEIILGVFRDLKARYPDLLLILAPRHLKRVSDVERLIEQGGGLTRGGDKGGKGLTWKTRSQILDGAPFEEDILLLDTMGELTAVYGIGAVAFVGGSFVPVGGHNPLEPAAAGVPVVFGPFMAHTGVDLLLDAGAALRAADGEELEEIMIQLLDYPEEARKRGMLGRQILQEVSGVVERTMTMLEREEVISKGEAFAENQHTSSH